uniref:Uncharacterized protein n=1 Tax=Sphaerodactylus townsendi TaxID=933632 RepID=A0ACB8FLT6_9SAUR
MSKHPDLPFGLFTFSALFFLPRFSVSCVLQFAPPVLPELLGSYNECLTLVLYVSSPWIVVESSPRLVWIPSFPKACAHRFLISRTGLRERLPSSKPAAPSGR